jgi:large subunit ribosomal protein L25
MEWGDETMKRVTVQAQSRERVGKEGTKKVRQQGNVPGVVYGQNTNLSIQLASPSLKALKAIHFSESAIIDMEIASGQSNESAPVIIKDIQYDPLTEEILHIDFLKVSLEEKIRVHIPIILKGEIKEVKEGEAVLEQILREIEIECLPLDIPEKIDLDISQLKVGESLHVGDLKLPETVKILTHLEETIAAVVHKTEEEEPTAPVEGEAPQEPEVIREKKEEPGEAKEGKEGKEAKEGKGAPQAKAQKPQEKKKAE